MPLGRAPTLAVARRSMATSASTENATEGEMTLFNELTKSLSPTKLEVADISGGCGAMYQIEVTSAAFRGMSPVQQHRHVTTLLKPYIKEMHGIRIKTFAAPSSS
ncbi:hypothetical protein CAUPRSCDRAFT_7173 [Caulochytrium protostelioides]|nr:hypothetical protein CAUPRSCDRAFT_7173 [Caulochytrium protostelioides]